VVTTIASTEQPLLLDKELLSSYANQYKQELLQNILPFWLNYSKDEINGGYFTCLDRTGKVYDTDKFIWLQVVVWCFSYMYTQIEAKAEWLEMVNSRSRLFRKAWKR
jgi:N-acylglucosamine 2-epimerase